MRTRPRHAGEGGGFCLNLEDRRSFTHPPVAGQRETTLDHILVCSFLLEDNFKENWLAYFHKFELHRYLANFVYSSKDFDVYIICIIRVTDSLQVN